MSEIEDVILAQFLASVFWRASLSNHHYFSEFLGASHPLTPFLKKATYDEVAAFEVADYDVKRISDELFTGTSLETLVVCPVMRIADTNLGETFVFLRAVFGGCIWSMSIPKMQPQSRGLMTFGARRDKVDSLNLQDDPELRDFVARATDKLRRGEVSNKLLGRMKG